MTMPRIAWIGGQFYCHAMPSAGFEPVHIPLTRTPVLGWEDIVAAVGRAPDAVVYCDRSLPPPLLGVERYPCPTLFHCIDSHIHGWYPVYALAFDRVAVSLRDHLPHFAHPLAPERAFWLPPFAEERYRPRPCAKEFDVLFAGTVDPATTPVRLDFLQRLGALLPGLAVRQGDFSDLLPRARVVLNIAERGDLNFRVFEALACGSCLLTPSVGHGQDELFADGAQLLEYTPDDAQDAAAKARLLLADALLRERMAREGLARIDAAHRPAHRAQAVARELSALLDAPQAVRRPARDDPQARQALRLVWLHWAENAPTPAIAVRYLAEARTLS